jgi:uncharacterized membrane protein
MSNHIDIEYKSAKSKFILFFKGFSMGVADVIPGVSGGTIALISGIYEHLIFAISTINYKSILTLIKNVFRINTSEKSSIPFIFLITLISGIGTGILLMSKIIPYLMEEFPFYTYSLFFGLILFSITIPYKKMDHGYIEYILMFLFALFLFLITEISPFKNFNVKIEIQNELKELKIDDSGKFNYFIPENQLKDITLYINHKNESLLKITSIEKDQNLYFEGKDINVFLRTKTYQDKLEIKGTLNKKGYLELIKKGWGKYLWIFFVASIAICAMILPGISGAYILVLFGEYQNILKALYDKQFDIILVFILGIVTGILSFVKLLKYLLENYHSYTMAALTGFLIGSLNKIFPGRYLSTNYTTKEIIIGILIIFLGAFLLYLLEKISQKIGDPEPPI